MTVYLNTPFNKSTDIRPVILFINASLLKTVISARVVNKLRIDISLVGIFPVLVGGW